MIQLNINLNKNEIETLVKFIKELKNIDYNIIMSYNNKDNMATIEFKEN